MGRRDTNLNAALRIFANGSEYFRHGNPTSCQYQTSNALIAPSPTHNTTVQGKGQVFFTTAGDWDCVAAVERLPALHYSVDFIFLSFGIMGFIVEL